MNPEFTTEEQHWIESFKRAQYIERTPYNFTMLVSCLRTALFQSDPSPSDAALTKIVQLLQQIVKPPVLVASEQIDAKPWSATAILQRESRFTMIANYESTPEERRQYALLQAAATIYAAEITSYTAAEIETAIVACVDKAIELLSHVRSRRP